MFKQVSKKIKSNTLEFDLIKLENKIKNEKNAILIIANGPSALSSKYGYLINKFKNVARINNYSIDNYSEYVGGKTNIWFNGANQGLKKRRKIPEKVIVFVPATIHINKKHRLNKIPRRIGILSGEYNLIKKQKMLLYEKITKINRLTTGLSSILWSSEKYNKVIIHGFDFFQESKEHYFDNKIKKILIKYRIITKGSKHDNIKEKQFVEKLILEKKVITLDNYIRSI